MIELAGEEWLSSAEVEVLLGVGSEWVSQLGRRGVLARERILLAGKSLQYVYRQSDVKTLCQDRARSARREKREARQDRMARMKAAGCWLESEDMLTTREAAERLGISVSALAEHVRRQRLFAIQKVPGQHGSPYLFPRRVIETFRDCPQRQKRRSVAVKGMGTYRRGEIGPEPEEAWLTADQVMLWLGIGEARVSTLGRSGRLRRVSDVRRGENGMPIRRFLYCKEDAIAYISDPKYQMYRERGQRAAITRETKAVDWAIKANGLDNSDRRWGYERYGW